MPKDIHAAARAGELKKIKAILAKRPSRIFEINDEGEDLLSSALLGGHVDCAQYLYAFYFSFLDLEAEIEKNQHDLKSLMPKFLEGVDNAFNHLTEKSWIGYTPIHVAVRQGLTHVLQTLLEAKGNPNEPVKQGQSVGFTPLFYCLSPTEKTKELSPLILSVNPIKNRESIFQLLIKHGADPNWVVNEGEFFGETPLHHAAILNDVAGVEMLLTHGAKQSALGKGSKFAGSTPLFSAAYFGHSEVVKLLLQKKEVDPTVATEMEGRSLTPFHAAVYYGHQATVQAFLEAKVDPNSVSENHDLQSFTGLHIAAIRDEAEVAKTLIQAKADVNQKVKTGVARGNAALHLAAHNGHNNVVKILLQAKVDPQAVMDEGEDEGYSALHVAVCKGHPEVVRTLIEAKCDPNEGVINGKFPGWSPLHLAVYKTQPHVIATLIENKANPDAMTSQDEFAGFSPLHLAVNNQQPQMIATLVENKASLEMPIQGVNSWQGHTALTLASMSGFYEEVRSLLKAKADPISPLQSGVDEGLTPIELAKEEGHQKVAQLLAKIITLSVIQVLKTQKKDSSAQVLETQAATDELAPAIDAIFSTSSLSAENFIVFDKPCQASFLKRLREKCREKKVVLNKDKRHLILSAVRKKVVADRISMHDLVQQTQEMLFKQTSPVKPTEIKETKSSVDKKHDEFVSLKAKINTALTEFAKLTTTPSLDELMASVPKDSLLPRSVKEACSRCRGLLSQHETNKNIFSRLETKFSSIDPTVLDLKPIEKLVQGALALLTEIKNNSTDFKEHKHSLSVEINKLKTDKHDKKSTKKEDKKAAVQAILDKKKAQKEIEKKQEEERRTQRAARKEVQKEEAESDSLPPTVVNHSPAIQAPTMSPQDLRSQGKIELKHSETTTSTDLKSQGKSELKYAQSTHGAQGRHRKLKILGCAVQHLLCIGVLAADYIELLEEKENAHSLSAADLREKQKQKEQRVETLHFALLYNISRCFQALKVYKQLDEAPRSSLDQISQELLEDLRNMIVKLGALEADKSLVLATAKQLAKSLPRTLCEMRKEYLTVPVLSETQINDLVNVFGFVTDSRRFELEAYPIPIDELPLYQQLAVCHESKKVAGVTPKQLKNKIWLKAIPIIKNIMAAVSKVHPRPPAKLSDDHFSEYFWREIQALKMLLSSCGVPCSVSACKKQKKRAKKAKDKLAESLEPTLKFYDFLAFCREHITNPVGHEFENAKDFLSYDVAVETIYRACFQAEALKDKPFFGDMRMRPAAEKKQPRKEQESKQQTLSTSVTALIARGGSDVISTRKKKKKKASPLGVVSAKSERLRI